MLGLDDQPLDHALSEFYRARRVLVTGHTGFKGGWLTMWLKQLGAEVCGIALAPDTDPNLHDLANVSHGIESHFADVADRKRLEAIIAAFRPELVFHLAAQALVLESYRVPVETYLTNVMGSIHVLESVRRTPSVRTVLMITSDKVYQNNESGIPLREEDRLGGPDPYSSSKACAELAIDSWRRSFFHEANCAKIASVRAGNVFGGGDWCADRLLPDIVRALTLDQEIVLRNPRASRPWQHVLDALFGYLLLGMRLSLSSDDFDEAWNFGPLSDERITVMEFSERVVAAWGHGRVKVAQHDESWREAALLRLDSRKSATKLRWHPLLPIEEAIDWSVRWYSSVLNDPDCAASMTAQQIGSFMERVGALSTNTSER